MTIEHLSVGEAADLLDRPLHQVRRTADSLWPNLPRVAGARIIHRRRLCELAAAIDKRFGRDVAGVSR